ncbi:MAG: sugar phosphate isomerase/epimerase [Desulfarculus sp.]|nr:sugar phosphate isomerase/epimerase [Pseudomonadota bacterium]MBV1718269.1 sugar phosphate isomerase/epimerase [Desulfarculus sp.]MBU4575588.1 sugar phosphate isomerase/epimerase [Pseudomonadota bacterium]MBU4597828.1 sugar phosphate isomerase/epimerase [Pseudomonadota bacterium]MBV1738041.1 sugar phosphate isomerase/epimerase [Desulfarculus sp.]
MRVLLAQVSLLPEILSKKISAWDLTRLAAQNGFQGVEWLDRLLPSLEPEALGRLGELSRQAGLGQGALSLTIPYDASPRRLDAATKRCIALLEVCSDMGVSVVRVALASSGLNLGHLLEIVSSLRTRQARRRASLGWAGGLTYLALARAGYARDRGHGVAPPSYPKEDLDRAARSLEPLAERAAQLGLALGMENHWGISGLPGDLLYTIERLRGYCLGVCLDLDNFYRDQDALAGVAALAPRAVHVHYKAHGGDAIAEAKRLGYRARLEALRAVGYAGAFSVEYEGPPPGLNGARRAAEVLRALWEPGSSPT